MILNRSGFFYGRKKSSTGFFLRENIEVMLSWQKILVVTQSEVQYIIQERMKELQELKHNVDVLKVG